MDLKGVVYVILNKRQFLVKIDLVYCLMVRVLVFLGPQLTAFRSDI